MRSLLRRAKLLLNELDDFTGVAAWTKDTFNSHLLYRFDILIGDISVVKRG